ncbi:hypothetical protein LB941_00900 [Ligilactobacillus sp. WILCCON 0076]|uniref:DNA-binding protein n=1 Tax=Ligilactobacillus ubinensis TaxID=2876789 RepID=A0A9X2FJB0_9LACO|nr:hypothetical protein [Ligilactobacillus ubinensis]MCP0885891.1 hypothetical protein [Ligilactobacillus ubinensis]
MLEMLNDKAQSALIEELTEIMKQQSELVIEAKFNPYMTQKDAAKYCGVCTDTFNVFKRAGLKPIVIPGYSRPMYSKRSIDEFMESHQL